MDARMMHSLSSNALFLGEIIWVNALLSGDNALVIAMACRNLRGRQRWLGTTLGAGLAIVCRIVCTVFIAALLRVPYLKIVAGVVLVWIAIRLIADSNAEEDGVAAGDSLFNAVRAIVVADVAMSIDNVLAISAIAHDDFVLIAVGVAISIPLVVVGANLIVGVINRFPILVWAGGGLLGWVAGGMAAEDPELVSLLAGRDLSFVLGAVAAVLVVAVAWTMKQRAARRADGA
jgi:YjbE family integral membrane protein